MRNSRERYGSLAMAFHWATAGLIVCAWTLAQLMDLLPKGDARASGIAVHIALGLSVLLVVVARFSWRMADPPPPAVPSRFGRWSERIAELVHYALYALLIVVPLLGIAYWFAKGNALPILGLLHIPSPLGADPALAKTMIGIHGTLANAIVILAGLHAAAALAHHYLLRDSTLTRMLPRRDHAKSAERPAALKRLA
jgi:cytochrome b561